MYCTNKPLGRKHAAKLVFNVWTANCVQTSMRNAQQIYKKKWAVSEYYKPGQQRVAIGVDGARAAHATQRASAQTPEGRHNAQVLGGAAVAPQVLRDNVVFAHREHICVCGGSLTI